MQQLSLPFIFVTAFFLSGYSFATETKDIFAGYRVIRASPQAFVSAMRLQDANMRLQDANIQNAERTHQQPSRLNRYFKIKNKVVRQDYISFQVYPDLPLLREYYETNEFVEFVVNEEQRVGNDIQLNIKMLTHKKESLSGRIEISRHEMGSLLKFYIMKSTYNPVVVDLFLRTFKLAKITFNEESDAAKQTVKETR